LRDLACDVLLSAEARRRGWFDVAYIEKMLAEHAAGRQNHHHRLWSLLSLELWCRTFLDRPDPGQGPLTL
jgi:asparagine synthase (glutamine-hydrolysing)